MPIGIYAHYTINKRGITDSENASLLKIAYQWWIDINQTAEEGNYISHKMAILKWALLERLIYTYWGELEPRVSFKREDRAAFNAQNKLMIKVYEVLLLSGKRFPDNYWRLYSGDSLNAWSALTSERYLLGSYEVKTKGEWIASLQGENKRMRAFGNPFPEGSHSHAFWKCLTALAEKPREIGRYKDHWNEIISLRSALVKVWRKQGKLAEADGGLILRGNKGKIIRKQNIPIEPFAGQGFQELFVFYSIDQNLALKSDHEPTIPAAH